MSGLLRSVVLASGRSIDSLVPGDGGDALVEFEVGDLRRHGFEVVASPEEDEPAHAHVVGDKDALDPPASSPTWRAGRNPPTARPES